MGVHFPLRNTDDAREQHLAHVAAFADEYLSNIFRRSGESYAQHCKEVSATLEEITDDPAILGVAMLHDIVVFPDESVLQRSPLHADGRLLIEQMSHLRRLHIDENTRDLDIVIDAFTQDERLLPLRMAHRLNDVRHLRRFPAQLQGQIARETLHMYCAIAEKIGMQEWRREMEDICFPVVHPKSASLLFKKFSDMHALDQACLTHATRFIKMKLRNEGMKASVSGRIKGVYSTYRKMMIKRKRFTDITDRLALRIIVKTPDECYRTLGVVHATMRPIPGKVKDYIGSPKENGYKSIHTVVYPLPGITEQPIEIQIRTEEMHRNCEYGIASHGEYKHILYALTSVPARVNLFQNLHAMRAAAPSARDFGKALQSHFREDRLFVFDPDDNLYQLAKPATALDFVCHVHDKRARLLKAVRINGRKASFHSVLHDGDTIEPIFGRSAEIDKTWLHAVRHAVHRVQLKKLMETVK